MISLLPSFYDEFEKISATVVMKELAPAAKRLMQRMTGTTARASIAQPATARRLRHALTGAGTPELMTEMHGMGKLLSTSEQGARQQAKQHFQGVLKQQGKLYKGVPGMEEQIGGISGHPRLLTRTGAEVGGPHSLAAPGTVASTPKAKLQTPQPQGTGMHATAMAPVNPYGATMMAPAGAR
jgi:hypothetical protein